MAIVSPSFGAPGTWPLVYQLGLNRLRDVFCLEPVEFPTTTQINAPTKDRARDLIAAFEDRSIKAVIASIGGNDQVNYVYHLPSEPFALNPKPFFGFSDNTHLANFLWLHGVPSYYGGSLFTQFAMQGEMDEFTIKYLRWAFFEEGEKELDESHLFNEIGFSWDDPKTLNKKRKYETNMGWFWDGKRASLGLTWGGCLESIDEILRHDVQLPTIEQFKNIILITETSQEIPTSGEVFEIFHALGERGILERIRGVVVGRPKAWEFNKPLSQSARREYRLDQQISIIKAVRTYNTTIPIVQNVDFGHTDPQIPIPYGMKMLIDPRQKKISVTF